MQRMTLPRLLLIVMKRKERFDFLPQGGVVTAGFGKAGRPVGGRSVEHGEKHLLGSMVQRGHWLGHETPDGDRGKNNFNRSLGHRAASFDPGLRA